jgi:hypothetical protein
MTMVTQAGAAAIQPISQRQGTGAMILNIQHRLTVTTKAEPNGLLGVKMPITISAPKIILTPPPLKIILCYHITKERL